jgi:hypothetical protein
MLASVQHQKLYTMTQVQPTNELELALKEAAQAELFRRINSHQRARAPKPKPALLAPVPQED